MAKKKVKKNLPQVKSEHAGALAEFEGQTWGGEGIDNSDILVPKIWLMQPMSDLVTDQKAVIGEFRDSLNKDRVLGTVDKPVELIVFGSFKTIIEFKDKEYVRTIPWSAEAAGLPIEDVAPDNTVIHRDHVLNYYVILPEDVKSGEVFPYVLSCKRTSRPAGKKIATQIKKLAMFKKPSAAKVLALSSYLDSNEKGKFFVMDIDVVRDSTVEEVKAAYEWHQALKASSSVVVDDADVNTAATSENEVKNYAPGMDSPPTIDSEEQINV